MIQAEGPHDSLISSPTKGRNRNHPLPTTHALTDSPAHFVPDFSYPDWVPRTVSWTLISGGSSCWMTWLAESMASVHLLSPGGELGAGHSHVAGPSLAHQAHSPSPRTGFSALQPGRDGQVSWTSSVEGWRGWGEGMSCYMWSEEELEMSKASRGSGAQQRLGS